MAGNYSRQDGRAGTAPSAENGGFASLGQDDLGLDDED